MLASEGSKVPLEEVPLGGAGGAAAGGARRGSRQCVACAQRPRPAEPAAAPPAPPAPLARLSEADFDLPAMASKPDDLEDRDPNELNTHVQIVWDDIIGEPEGARSPECAWRLGRACFRGARDGCYTLLAVLLAPPCALALGCCFACLAFEQIWCTAPCIRCAKIYLASARTLTRACVSAYLEPVCGGFGHALRHIRVNFRRDAPEEKDMLII